MIEFLIECAILSFKVFVGGFVWAFVCIAVVVFLAICAGLSGGVIAFCGWVSGGKSGGKEEGDDEAGKTDDAFTGVHVSSLAVGVVIALALREGKVIDIYRMLKERWGYSGTAQAVGNALQDLESRGFADYFPLQTSGALRDRTSYDAVAVPLHFDALVAVTRFPHAPFGTLVAETERVRKASVRAEELREALDALSRTRFVDKVVGNGGDSSYVIG